MVRIAGVKAKIEPGTSEIHVRSVTASASLLVMKVTLTLLLLRLNVISYFLFVCFNFSCACYVTFDPHKCTSPMATVSSIPSYFPYDTIMPSVDVISMYSQILYSSSPS
jgi:hypothetical protein